MVDPMRFCGLSVFQRMPGVSETIINLVDERMDWRRLGFAGDDEALSCILMKFFGCGENPALCFVWQSHAGRLVQHTDFTCERKDEVFDFYRGHGKAMISDGPGERRRGFRREQTVEHLSVCIGTAARRELAGI